MDEKTYTALKDLAHILVLVFLAGVFLYLLTWTNTIKCKTIPGWCDVFYAIKGKPKTAIVFGDSGLGDPDLLQTLLANPKRAGVHATMMHIDTISPGTLNNFDLVIVEKARKISSEKLKIFMDYANTGGRLVWIGDTGTEADVEDFLFKDELYLDKNVGHIKINAWARKNNGFVLMFNRFLSVDYFTNYCEVKQCNEKTPTCPGNLIIPDNENPLTFGIISGRKMCFMPGKDFAIVKNNFGSASTVSATINFLGILSDEKTIYGNNNPIILSSSKSNLFGLKIGDTVAYYAVPPEYLADPSLPEEMRYPTLIEDMYYGMLFG